jgi:16S rRNA U1498 N3-methylase RsmE
VKHEFALYVDLSQEPGLLKPGSLFVLTDTELINRIANVLRLQPAQELTLFDRAGHAGNNQEKITCTARATLNAVLQLYSFSSTPQARRLKAIYSAVELGASVRSR